MECGHFSRIFTASEIEFKNFMVILIMFSSISLEEFHKDAIRSRCHPTISKSNIFFSTFFLRIQLLLPVLYISSLKKVFKYSFRSTSLSFFCRMMSSFSFISLSVVFGRQIPALSQIFFYVG